MKQKLILAVAVTGLSYLILNWYASNRFLGTGAEGLFKIGSCVRDDEFGVIYKITGTVKGKTQAQVVASEKYPSQDQYKIGYVKNMESNENPQKLYAATCP